MKIHREVMWPTPIYWQDIPDAKKLNQYLMKHIKAWYKSDIKKGKPTGEFKTNSGMVGTAKLIWIGNQNINI